MSNASTPTSQAVPQRSANSLSQTDQPGQQSSSARNGPNKKKRPPLSKRAKEGLSKKLQSMNHLSHNLDILVFAELCALYYMDCSSFRLMIRWIAQTLFISPKAEDSAVIIPNYHVSAILGPNAFCILMHILTALPSAGEASRGYLRGGILVDFVGQKAPTSKLTLLLLDIMIFGLQCFLLTVNMERDKISQIIKPSRAAAVPGAARPSSSTAPAAPNPGQDHDAEERGVLRNGSRNETSDIEMRSLAADGSGLSDEDKAAQRDREYEGLVDVLRSGTSTLSNFNIRESLRIAWARASTPQSATAYAIQNVGYNATLAAALAAQQRARAAATAATA